MEDDRSSYTYLDKYPVYRFEGSELMPPRQWPPEGK